MKIRILPLFVLLLMAAQASPPVTITSPAAGDILHSKVTITGHIDLTSFSVAQLEFAYASASQPTDTWFTLQTFSGPISESTLAVWDTTSITDGDYVIRLRVTLEDGSFQEATVPVTVMNDTALPTPTSVPTATPEFAVQVPTAFLLAASPTPTELPRPTPTGLPHNPASLGQNEIYGSLGRGALVMLGLFALSGLIFRFRRY